MCADLLPFFVGLRFADLRLSFDASVLVMRGHSISGGVSKWYLASLEDSNILVIVVSEDDSVRSPHS